MGNESINWDKLGFDYIKTDKRFLQVWKNGEWQEGTLTDDNVLHISEGSTALHYGQQCFEGLKAYRCKDGSINLFRPDQNAARMQRSCARLLMPHVPTDVFIDSVTFAYLAHYAPAEVAGIRIVARTASSPTLPYITALSTGSEGAERIREVMNTALQQLPQVAATLGVQDVLPASEADYQKLLDYRQEAIEYGFAELA